MEGRAEQSRAEPRREARRTRQGGAERQEETLSDVREREEKRQGLTKTARICKGAPYSIVVDHDHARQPLFNDTPLLTCSTGHPTERQGKNQRQPRTARHLTRQFVTEHAPIDTADNAGGHSQNNSPSSTSHVLSRTPRTPETSIAVPRISRLSPARDTSVEDSHKREVVQEGTAATG